MVEQGQFGNRVDEYITGLKAQADVSRAAAEDYERQVEFFAQEKELLERYAQLPIAMQISRFLMEQIAATTSAAQVGVTTEEPPAERTEEVSLGARVTRLRPRTRLTSSRGGQEGGDVKRYSVAPQVKPIMIALVSSGPDTVPETLDQLFDRMYPGQDWRSRTVYVPVGIGQASQRISYGDDLASETSIIRGMIRGADKVISTRMKGNTDPAFTFRGKKAAPELVQIYHKIETIGWEAYDGFMVRNSIREA